MNAKIFIIVIMTVLSSAVQGYAQEYNALLRLQQRHKNIRNVYTNNPTTFGHGERYYPTECRFDTWSWYSFHQYTKRFKQNMLNRSEYFDNQLGCYIYGKLSDPYKIEDGAYKVEVDGDSLLFSSEEKTEKKYLFERQLCYYCVEKIKMIVLIEHGYAIVDIRDDLGNFAVCKMRARIKKGGLE